MIEFEIDQVNINNLLTTLGVDKMLSARIRVNGKNRPVVTLSGDGRELEIGVGSGLAELIKGNPRPFVDRVASGLRRLSEDCSSLDLLAMAEFRRVCLSEIDLTGDFSANVFLKSLVELPEACLPVFYGSTSGINFAEVLETALCASEICSKGIHSNVVFDYESIKSTRSQTIFAGSRMVLPNRLQNVVDEAVNSAGGDLMLARLSATERLLAIFGKLPKIHFVDSKDIFAQLSGEFRFTVGQLLLASKVAGQNPQLFTARRKVDGSTKVFTRDDLLATSDLDQIKALSDTIAEFMGGTKRAGGFTFYVRDARIGQFDGTLAVPFKLTDKANIYKILLSLGSLFDNRLGSGSVLLPITRNRIQLRFSSEPFDPISLFVLAQDQPRAFEALMSDFKRSFSVLSPDEAVMVGTADRKFLVEEYFAMEELR